MFFCATNSGRNLLANTDLPIVMCPVRYTRRRYLMRSPFSSRALKFILPSPVWELPFTRHIFLEQQTV